jgi:hypothetical protein
MRYRIWAVIGVVLLTVALSSCTTGRVARGTVGTPVPTKTLRPTFTNTPAKPTVTPSPTEVPATATPEAPTDTPVPPTDEPSPTPEASKLTANSAVNVRSGPGTSYAQIGRLQAGQSFIITGKNSAGDWWQFDFNGRSGWVSGELVRATGGEQVETVAVAPPPTTAPRPTARPAARPVAQPTAPPQPPAASYPYAAFDTATYPNTNDYTTVRCRAVKDFSSGKGPDGLRLRISGPVSAPDQPFNATIERANTGMEDPMQYMYQNNCKVELRPFVAGTYTAILVDGGGNQVSEPISFTPSGITREFNLVWNPR